jgi:hypothetical protein
MKVKVTIDFDDLGTGEREYTLTDVQETGVRSLLKFAGVEKLVKVQQVMLSLWCWGLDEAVKSIWANFASDYRTELEARLAELNRQNWKTIWRGADEIPN